MSDRKNPMKHLSTFAACLTGGEAVCIACYVTKSAAPLWGLLLVGILVIIVRSRP